MIKINKIPISIKIVIKKYNNYYYDKNNKSFKRDNKRNKIPIEIKNKI